MNRTGFLSSKHGVTFRGTLKMVSEISKEPRSDDISKERRQFERQKDADMQCTPASFLSYSNNRRPHSWYDSFLWERSLQEFAVITEFLLITGVADTIPIVVSGHRQDTGVGKSIFFRFFFHIRFTSPEVTVRFVHSNLLIHF